MYYRSFVGCRYVDCVIDFEVNIFIFWIVGDIKVEVEGVFFSIRFG